MEQETIIASVFRRAHRAPDAPALIEDDHVMTYGELAECIRSAARFLRKRGIRKGDRILLEAKKERSFVVGYFACHAVGAVAVPIEPEAAQSRVAYVKRMISPKMFIHSRPHAGSRECETLSWEILWKESRRSAGSEESFEIAVPRPCDMADILFTSGSTGIPRGAVLTHKNISAASANMIAFIRNGPHDREVAPMPLSHSFGLGRLRSVLRAGGALIFSDLVPPAKLFSAMEKWQATGLSSVAGGYELLIKLAGEHLGAYGKNLAYIEIGSAPLAREHKEFLIRIFPHTRICMHYGLTEASRSFFTEFHRDADNLNSIGRPAPNVRARIIGEQGADAAYGEEGELVVRGDTVFQEYWGNPEETQASFIDGWLRTGDLARMGKDGYVYLTGRIKDIINIGGRKVSPAEIEAHLIRHSAVEEAVCVGVRLSDSFGERLYAVLVARHGTILPDRDGLIAYLRERLEPYKIPTDFFWLDRMPKTVSGKIQRATLREFIMKKYNAHAVV